MIKLGDGYEIILGSSIDPQFGPVRLFGMGGQLVEVCNDKALALPPLNTTLARRMMEATKIYSALKGVRGRKSVDLAALDIGQRQFSKRRGDQETVAIEAVDRDAPVIDGDARQVVWKRRPHAPDRRWPAHAP